MELNGSTTVVTGAANGIGRSLALRFAYEGARVAVADIDGDGARRVAQEIEAARPGAAIAVEADVATAEGNTALIAAAESALGAIDLFCANAGIGGGYDLDTPAPDWERAFAVNVRAHVEAARLLVPGWIERGRGYFLSTASAAGVLTAIGSAPYTVTKHAAVGFAEWLSITYGDRGVRVSCLCPMGVDTQLLADEPATGRDRLGTEVIRATATLLQPDEVASAVVIGLQSERFLILPHPEVHHYEQIKVNDRDAWLAGMRGLQAHHLERLGEPA